MVGRDIVLAFFFVLCGAGVSSQYHNCTDVDIGNGRCDVENNNEACLYDGGDCCPCTCVDGLNYQCGMFGFTCKDPDAAGSDGYVCMESSSTNISCPPETQREWIVENITQARALAESIRCYGGSFEVTWKGRVAIDKTISIFDGASVSVTSNEVNATIAGDGQICLFKVVNASLHVRDITLSHGYNNYGGAIAASDSRLSFHGVSFSNNIASNGGGAVLLSRGTVVSFDGETSFFNNTSLDGGALYMIGGSNASWTGNTTFSSNTATSGNGGALCILDSSRAVWMATSDFVNNSAFFGGGLYVAAYSSVVWMAASHFVTNRANTGGVLCLTDGGNAIWNASSQFFNNSAEDGGGGAVYVAGGSTSTWMVPSQFLHNSAYFGGALCIMEYGIVNWTTSNLFSESSVSQRGALYGTLDNNATRVTNTTFSGNVATKGKGGALYIEKGSASWAGGNLFFENAAWLGVGGALYVTGSSSVDWTGASYFLGNFGVGGGALYVSDGSTATWSASSFFSTNSAQGYGGAVYSNDNVTLSWVSTTLFAGNTAKNGGALFVTNGARMKFVGKASFTSNSAQLNGGAVGSTKSEESVISFEGATRFVKNICGAGGGAMALVQSLTVLFVSNDITYSQNYANVSGGAVFLASTGIGPVFRNVNFVGNSAQTGGAVHATGSGTEVSEDNIRGKMDNPTIFDGCSFIGNIALATGGAVDSAAGQDIFNNTLFKGNEARAGGALRLGGSASIDNCLFEENISELGEGPAVSNVGYLSSVTNSIFLDNAFNCDPQTFLDFNEVCYELFLALCLPVMST